MLVLLLVLAAAGNLVAASDRTAAVEFPEEALRIPASAGFEGVDAAALQARNARRVEALRGKEAKVCDAQRPYPEHQRRPLVLLHVPKAGTPMITTVARYACLGNASRIPAFGDPQDPSVCAKRRVTPGNAKYHRGAGCRANGRDVTRSFYEHCTAPVALYHGLSRKAFDRGDLHEPLRPGLLDRGAAFVGMFRLPRARLASAYNFDRHIGFGMPPTSGAARTSTVPSTPSTRFPHRYRDLMLRKTQSPDAYARFPFIRGCTTKMLTGTACVGPPFASGDLCYTLPANWSRLCARGQQNALVRRQCNGGVNCAGPGKVQVASAAANLRRMAFAGITELWDLSLCLFHRLHGGERSPGDDRVSNKNEPRPRPRRPGRHKTSAQDASSLTFIDVADELLFERVLDRVEREVACVVAHLREGLPTETCADPLPTYEPPFGQEANAVLAPLEPLKRERDPSLAEAVDALKKGKNVRFPGLLDERIEECGPNRNCYEAVKRERNASKPPLEEFLSRLLGQK